MAASSSRRSPQYRNNASSYAQDASRLIRENMKCPVCLEVLLPPIYQCETGHNICYLCVDEVTECPLCKSDYGDTRNYFAEELVNSMTFPCKYEEYGCHKTFLGSQLKDHQTNCECQPYRCPELACQEVVGIHQMSKHLDKHGFKVMKGDVHQASVEILDDHFERKTEYNPWRISAFGVEFYTVSTRSREGVWYFWAYGLGVQKDLKKYSYEIVLYSEEKQIMYRGIIQSLRNSPEDIMKNGNCLITTDHVIKSIRKGGRIKCQVYFIQGKNWVAARGTTTAEAKRNEKNVKVKKTKKDNAKCKEKTKNKTKIFSSITTFTSPLLSNQSSSITSQLSAPQRSKSRGLGITSAKSSPMDIIKDLNGNKLNSKQNTTGSGGKVCKTAKLPGIGTRPSTSTVSDDENSFVQRVRDTLRCPTCNEVITPPVFQCIIGHCVCHKCRMSRQDCSLCLSPLTDCRNFFAEELLYRTFQRCLYSKHGCKVCLPSAQMKSHEAVCDHAPFECPFNVCRALLRADDLLDHMKTHQVSTVKKELKTEVFIPRNPPDSAVSIIPNILTVDKIAFYPIIVRESDGSWLFYVITHNYPKYRFELLVRKQSKTMAFQGPVLSLRSNYSQVKVKGNALVLTDKAVKSLKVYDKLSLQIKIIKIDSPVEGALGKDSTLSLPSSWILTPRSGEIVSKTELFANKKTSVTPDDDSEEDDDTPSLIHGRTSERDTATASDSDRGESDLEDTNSEDHTVSGTSLANSTLDEIDCEYEIRMSARSQKSNESNTSKATARNSNTQSNALRSPRPSTSSLSSQRKGRKVTLQEGMHNTEGAIDSMEQRQLQRNTASSTVISFDHKIGVYPTFDRNNNPDCTGSRRRQSMSTESLPLAGTVSPVDTCTSECDNSRTDSLLNDPISILKSTDSSLLRAGNSSSMHSLKKAREVCGVDSQSSSIISNPLLLPVRILKNTKRSRSASKHRVRLSDQVVCCGGNDLPGEDINGNTACKSQSNLRISSSNSKTCIRTVPSKHVLSVQVRQDEDKKQTEPELSKSNEFQQLKQAISSHDTCKPFMEEDDLLTAKSLSEMTEAVIGGSFDVVKSVISLFTSDSPDTPQENGEGTPKM